MQLSTKWELRQAALELISYLVCPTTVAVVLPIVVDAAKFMEVGLAMYPGVNVSKGGGTEWVLQAFVDHSVWPWLRYLPLTLAMDLVFRRLILNLRS